MMPLGYPRTKTPTGLEAETPHVFSRCVAIRPRFVLWKTISFNYLRLGSQMLTDGGELSNHKW